MRPLNHEQIRGCFVNASAAEVQSLSMPGLHEVMWQDREYLGWRDRQAHRRGYLVYWEGDTPVGLVLRASDFSLQPGISAMCALCRITQPSHQVTMFSAPRAGKAGLEGNTVGTYICDDLACSHLIRILPAESPMMPSRRELLAQRSSGLSERVAAFAASVMKTA